MTTRMRIEEAAAWFAAQERPDFDWDGFTNWLEADPANRAAFDEMLLLDCALDDRSSLVFEEARPANDNSRRWARWLGGLVVVAAATGLVLLPTIREQFMPTAPTYSYSTASGQTRLIQLPNGVAVSLAPASLLSVDGNRLSIKGEAYFAIDHRPSRKLVVVAGPLRILDVGTQFTASADVHRASVEVADGKIQVDSGDRLVLALTTGQRLLVEDGKVSISVVQAGNVGDWRDGSLTFDGMPLSLVARRLTRYSSEKVAVDPSVADRHFSGVVAIGQGAKPGEAVASIMDLGTKRQGDRLVLVPRP